MRKILFGFLVLVIVFNGCFKIMAQSADDDLALEELEAMLHKNDLRSSFMDRDYTSTIKLVSVDPERDPIVREITVFRRDKGDKLLMVTLKPEERKGSGRLRVDDNMWFYDPHSRKFTHTSLKENVEGTDARNNDFKRPQMGVDYKVKGYSKSQLGAYPVYIIELEAVNDEVPFPTQKTYIRQDNYLTLMVESYSLSGRLMRVSYFPKYTKVGDKYVATVTIHKDALVEGKQTQVTISDISLAPLPDSIFTKAYLEKINK